MAFLGGSSLSRSLISAARTSTVRSSPSLSSLPRTPLLRNAGSASRRSLFSLPANVGQLECAHSLLPFHSVVTFVRMTCHISSEARAFCELSQGTSIDPSQLYLSILELDQHSKSAALGWASGTQEEGFRAPYLDKVA